VNQGGCHDRRYILSRGSFLLLLKRDVQGTLSPNPVEFGYRAVSFFPDFGNSRGIPVGSVAKKSDLGFAASALRTFLVLSLVVGLTGVFMSITALGRNPSGPFLIVAIGSPVFNIVLSVIATMGNRLRVNSPKAGALLLIGVGFLFAWVLVTTFAVFVFGLHNY